MKERKLNRFERWLYAQERREKIIARATVWNLISSLINAGLTAMVVFVMSWSGNAQDIGVFSIATAVAYQVQAIAFFGVRNLHIADVDQEYAFSDYVYVNLFSIPLMALGLFFLSAGKGYTTAKTMVIVVYALFRVIDVYEALFHDEYQRQGRIDIGLVLQTIRMLASFVVMALALLLFHSLLLACTLALAVSIVLIWVQNRAFLPRFACHMQPFVWETFKKIVIICFPICVAGFISMYLVNAPKYAIDSVLGDDAQAVFAILMMPVFTINLLSTVIYRPYITEISEAWLHQKTAQFFKQVLSMCLVILVISIGITGFGYLIGLQLLSLLYNTDISAYRLAFTILLLGGGMNTYAAFLAQIMVIIKEQNKSFLIYLVSFAFTIGCGTWLVETWSLDGAAWLYILSSAILALLSAGVILWKSRKVLAGPSGMPAETEKTGRKESI